MVTNRTPRIHGRKLRINPEVIAAFEHARELHNDPKKSEEWESEGGLRREYLDARGELESLLGRELPAEYVIDTIGQEEVGTGIYAPWDVESWKEAVAIRRELERLANE
jgi:hypothetical protein